MANKNIIIFTCNSILSLQMHLRQVQIHYLLIQYTPNPDYYTKEKDFFDKSASQPSVA